jgi:hypothetical protein
MLAEVLNARLTRLPSGDLRRNAGQGIGIPVLSAVIERLEGALVGLQAI